MTDALDVMLEIKKQAEQQSKQTKALNQQFTQVKDRIQQSMEAQKQSCLTLPDGRYLVLKEDITPLKLDHDVVGVVFQEFLQTRGLSMSDDDVRQFIRYMQNYQKERGIKTTKLTIEKKLPGKKFFA